jgi:hypothetical protein
VDPSFLLVGYEVRHGRVAFAVVIGIEPTIELGKRITQRHIRLLVACTGSSPLH